MLKTITGMVVSETAFKENSKILNIYTEEGIIGVLSKGCKNIKSPLRTISSKLVYGEFTIYYKEDHLSTLKEGVLKDDFYHIKTDLELISYFAYLTELVMQVVKQNDDSMIYSLYMSTIRKIEEGLNPKVMMNILEIKLLDYLGVGINLNSCSLCGSTKNIMTIDPTLGGYVCSHCYQGQMIFDEKTRKMLRMYYLVDIDTIKELKIKDYVIENVNLFVSTYYDTYTGLYLHSKDFLNRTIQIA